MKWHEPRAAVASWLLAAVTLACLLPFLGKAFHMDDPLFIWTARHLQSHPFDFYGFNVNWSYQEQPMSHEMQNPPLAAYYLAVIGAVFGWSECALHFGFLLPAIAFVLGTYFLGRRLCSHPFAAALAVVAMPVFMLSSTSVMCDTMMAALWVWAVYFWLEGLNPERPSRLWLAAALMAACSLTKYFGVCLIPLLIAYSALQQPKTWCWLKYFALPVLVLAGYQWMTARLYGQGLLWNAASYVTTLRVEGGWVSKLLETLAFCGGCTFIALAALPLLWGRKGLLAGALGVGAAGLLMVAMKKVGVFSVVEDGHVKCLFLIQMAMFILGGMVALTLAVSDATRSKTPASILLVLWLVGGLVFVGAVNWTVSGRNILPLAPAVALLVIRRMESVPVGGRPDPFRHWWWPLGISLAVALMVARADWQWADSERTVAGIMKDKLTPLCNGIAFEGHWGFHYYMEQLGARPLAQTPLRLTSNEAVVLPMDNTCIFDLPSSLVESLAKVDVTPSRWISIQNIFDGAGYYSDEWGPAPFIFGPATEESYWVFRVK